MWGTYCCKSNLEADRGMLMEECDGSLISLDSMCCQNNEYEQCRDSRGCIDFGALGGIYMNIVYIIQILYDKRYIL